MKPLDGTACTDSVCRLALLHEFGRSGNRPAVSTIDIVNRLYQQLRSLRLSPLFYRTWIVGYSLVFISMRKRSRKDPNEHEDIHQIATRMVRHVIEALGEPDLSDEGTRKRLAQALGRLGGLKGGNARAAKLTKEQRRESASKAARARWSHAKKD